MVQPRADHPVREIPQSAIDPDPNQPRKTFDPEGIDQLAASLSTNGLLQPIVVRPHPDGSLGRFLLVAGERRWRAAGALGWDTIPSIVRDDLTDAEAAKLQLLENIVRRDLNPVEEAQAFQRMLGQGYTLQELSGAVGMPDGHIAWRVQMLNAREDVLALVSSGQVKPLVAHALSRLSEGGQGRALRAMTSQRLTYQEVHALCERIYSEENQAEMFPEIPKLTAEEIQAVQTFADVFGRISATLDRLNRMEERRPGSMVQALSIKGGLVESQIDEAVKGLGRVKRALQTGRMHEMAGRV